MKEWKRFDGVRRQRKRQALQAFTPDSVVPRKSRYIQSAPRILEASNEFHSGRCIWERKQGIWVCTQASDCLNFLRKLDPSSAKLDLARRGYDWAWVNPSSAGHRTGVTDVVGNVPHHDPKHGAQAIPDMNGVAVLPPRESKKPHAYDLTASIFAPLNRREPSSAVTQMHTKVAGPPVA